MLRQRNCTTTKDKLDVLREWNYENKNNLFDRIESGETFTREQLSAMGYDRWCARNLAHFLTTGEEISLGWE